MPPQANPEFEALKHRGRGLAAVFMFVALSCLCCWVVWSPLSRGVDLPLDAHPRRPLVSLPSGMQEPSMGQPVRTEFITSLEPQGSSRTESAQSVESAVPSAAEIPEGLVRVYGLAQRLGKPLPDYDLVFQSQSPGFDLEEVEWGPTDEAGRFEVWLVPGFYAVANSVDGAPIANLTVGAGIDGLLVDLDVPSRSTRD